MNKRSIRETSFELHCNKMLRDIMGKYAAITAYMEISCRKMDELTKNLKGQDKKKYLKEESAKYDIQLNDLPEELQPNVKAKSYMMLPWATFDSFFHSICQRSKIIG